MVSNIGLDSKDYGKWKMPAACVTLSWFEDEGGQKAARIVFFLF